MLIHNERPAHNPETQMAQDAIAFLKEEHKSARKLLDALSHTTARGIKTRADLLLKIHEELSHHMQLEEEIFYPAFKEAVERKKDAVLYYEAKEEHSAARKVLKDLENADPASQAFGGKAKVLKELVEHHAEEEEAEMFPRAREVLTKAELQELASRMTERKQELLSGRAWDTTSGALHP